MSRLLQFLIRAYLPLAARHTLLDGAAQAWRKAPAAPADGAVQPIRVASMPRRPARPDDGRRAASLAA